MPGEVRIQVDVDAAGHYRFRVRNGSREITTAVDPDIATSFYEDLRLLRWKSVGARDPGDVLLSHVGDRLAHLIAAPDRWDELGLVNEARQVRVQFSQAAHRLMPFPWELLRINNAFLIGAQGSHLVREAPVPGGRNRRRNPLINIVHMSLGTDSGLRFDEERCKLLETVPESIPIEFLIDPSPEFVEMMLEGFRPHIVIISGHGHYDDLRGEHYLSIGRDQLARTAQLVAVCASYGCKLLILSTCESARLGGRVVDDGTILPADLIAFTFPVETTTATQSITCLLQCHCRRTSFVKNATKTPCFGERQPLNRFCRICSGCEDAERKPTRGGPGGVVGYGVIGRSTAIRDQSGSAKSLSAYPRHSITPASLRIASGAVVPLTLSVSSQTFTLTALPSST